MKMSDVISSCLSFCVQSICQWATVSLFGRAISLSISVWKKELSSNYSNAYTCTANNGQSALTIYCPSINKNDWNRRHHSKKGTFLAWCAYTTGHVTTGDRKHVIVNCVAVYDSVPVTSACRTFQNNGVLLYERHTHTHWLLLQSMPIDSAHYVFGRLAKAHDKCWACWPATLSHYQMRIESSYNTYFCD